MRQRLKLYFADPLFRQSGLIFASSVVVNIFNLIFWLFMVRKLTPEDYGILNSLVSVLMFFSMPVSILQTVITRYTSRLMAQEKEGEFKYFIFHFVKVMGFFLSLLIIFFILFSPSISIFLRIEGVILIYMVAVGIFFSYFSTIALGILSGLQKFNDVALNSVATGITKLIAGFSLVLFGLKALGALMGFVFSNAVAALLSFYQLPTWLRRFREKSKTVKLETGEIYGYFLPVSLGLLSFFALTNMDIILVKHFFEPLEAGYYSVAQMVGKIVLFIPGAVGIVMFPKIVDSHTKNEETLFILKKCLGAVSILCGLATFCSFLFPTLILKILTGHSVPMAVSLIKFFSLSMGFFALVNILILYHLSIHEAQYIYVVALLALLQFIGIWFFHSSLAQVIAILLVFSIILFVSGILSALKRG